MAADESFFDPAKLLDEILGVYIGALDKLGGIFSKKHRIVSLQRFLIKLAQAAECDEVMLEIFGQEIIMFSLDRIDGDSIWKGAIGIAE